MADRVTLAVADGIAQVRLSRPDKMNALDPAMFDAIVAVIDTLAGRDDVRCVVLAGEGRAFCAGLDMQSMASGGSGLDLATRTHGPANRAQQVAYGWRALPMPVIAAVHGVAFGGGLQIMSGADIRIAHPAARLSVRETHWGLVPDMAGFALWRGLRPDRLAELVYTAREFDAIEAEQIGLVTQLSDDPLAAATALATAIAGRNPHAIRGCKRLLAAMDGDDAAVLQAESDEQLRVIRQPNQVEAVRAAMAGRAPLFID